MTSALTKTADTEPTNQPIISTESLLTTLQSMHRGGSAKGVSTYKLINNCGAFAAFREQDKLDNTWNDDDDRGDRFDARLCGTYFHQLQELFVRGQLDTEVWDLTDRAVNDELIEAFRLFRAYRKEWGDVGARFGGAAVSAEMAIPSTPAGEQKLQELYGDKITGLIDAVVHVSNPDVAKENTGLDLEVGLYLVDYKTHEKWDAKHEMQYRFDLQGATYLHIFNMENPQTPALGMIYDVIYRHKNLSRFSPTPKGHASYAAHLQAPAWDDTKVIEAMVKLSKQNWGVPNPNACFTGYTPCKYFVNGRCPRY